MRHYRVTLSDVFEAHREALEYGGREGVVNLNGIESAIARPYSGYYRFIYQKSAALLHGLVKNHGFADGNKRTALVATTLLIDRSGYELNLQEHERFDDIIVAVADSSMSFEELQIWFKARIQRALT